MINFEAENATLYLYEYTRMSLNENAERPTAQVVRFHVHVGTYVNFKYEYPRVDTASYSYGMRTK